MSAMKEWPKNGDTLSLKEIVDPLVDAFDQCYNRTRKNEAADFTYKGLDFGAPEKAEGLSPAESLTNAGFAAAERAKGQTPLHVILETGVKLGIEQGRRIQIERSLLTSSFNEIAAAPSAGWPENARETVSFTKLSDPLVKATKHYYSLRRKNVGKDVDYKGYNVGNTTLVCSPPPDETLTADCLAYHKERDRDAAEVIIGIAIQIGIEQGQRLLEKDPQIIALKKKQDDADAASEKAWNELPADKKKEILKRMTDDLNRLMGPK